MNKRRCLNWLSSTAAFYRRSAETTEEAGVKEDHLRMALTLEWVCKHSIEAEEGMFRISGPGVSNNETLMDLVYSGDYLTLEEAVETISKGKVALKLDHGYDDGKRAESLCIYRVSG